jgi:ABC-type multidrug transport system fused ATPase/permease subunit
MKDLIIIIGTKNLKKFFLLSILTVIAALFEAFSIGLILPIISIINTSDFSNYPNYLKSFIKILEISNYYSLVIIFFIFVIIIFFLRFFIFLYSDLYKIKFHSFIRVYIIKKIFKNYVNSDYYFFLKNNSSSLIKNIINETNVFCDKYIFGLLYILTDFFNLFFIILLLMLYNFKITSFVLVGSLLLSFGYIFSLRKRINLLSKKRSADESELFKIVSETFNSIKDIKIYQTENFFLRKIDPVINSSIENYKKLFLFQSFPKPLFELILLIFFLIFIFISIFFLNENINSIFSTFALFGAASFRILPSVSRIIQGFQDVRFSNESKNIIRNNILELNSNNNLEINNFIFDKKKDSFNEIVLTAKYFGYSDSILFKDVSFEVKKNQCIGIVGESGVGKSTLVNTIMGLLQFKDVNLVYRINKQTIKNRKITGLFAYVPQSTFLLDDDVVSNITFGINKSEINFDLLNKVIIDSELTEFINNLPNKMQTRLGDKGNNISGGQIQRISLARALYRNSEILILDEFTNQLDNVTEKKILSTINNLKKEKTIIIVSHKNEPMQLCDTVYRIHDQKIDKIK